MGLRTPQSVAKQQYPARSFISDVIQVVWQSRREVTQGERRVLKLPPTLFRVCKWQYAQTFAKTGAVYTSHELILRTQSHMPTAHALLHRRSPAENRECYPTRMFQRWVMAAGPPS